MSSSPPPLSEASMQSAESDIPRLASEAGRAAHARALASAARMLMKSAEGQLVEVGAGGSVVVIKTLLPGTPVTPGTVLHRVVPAATKPTGER